MKQRLITAPNALRGLRRAPASVGAGLRDLPRATLHAAPGLAVARVSGTATPRLLASLLITAEESAGGLAASILQVVALKTRWRGGGAALQTVPTSPWPR